MPGWDIQSWVGSISDGSVKSFYLQDIDTKVVTGGYSCAWVAKMYNEGLIRTCPDVIKTFLNLPTTNPYVTAWTMELKLYVVDKDTLAAIPQAMISIGDFTSTSTGSDGSAYTAAVPKKLYSVIVTKTGYQTLNVSLDLTSVGSYSTYTFKLTKTAQPPQPTPTTKTRKRLELTLRDISTNALALGLISPALLGVKVGANALASRIPEITQKVRYVLPAGWTITEVKYEYPTLTLDFEETGTDPITISLGAIIVVIAVVVAFCFLCIVAYKLIDLESQKIDLEKTKALADAAGDLAKIDLNGDGIPDYTAAEINQLLATIGGGDGEGGDTLDKLKDILMVAIIGMLIIQIVQMGARK